MNSITNKDQVFGLPFLFTGGLPCPLEGFSEANLRCFLTYLIEVSCKSNCSNVWRKPPWWISELIPYSPLELDVRMVAPARVSEELRNLVLSCYKYNKSERILQVSKQLSEIPRTLLAVRDNGDGTKTFYSSATGAIYVTVTNGNLTYDDGTLNKVSSLYLENYGNEHSSMIKETQKVGEVSIYKLIPEMTAQESSKKFNQLHGRTRSRTIQPKFPPSTPKKEIFTIEIDDDDEEDDKVTVIMDDAVPKTEEKLILEKHSPDKILKTEKQNWGVCKTVEQEGRLVRVIDLVDSSDELDEASSGESEDEVQFVAEFINTKPGPRSYKEKIMKQKQKEKDEVIVLSDDEDSDVSSIKLLNAFSLSEISGQTDGRKSILEPLLRSPVKDSPSERDQLNNLRKPFLHLSPHSRPTYSNSPNQERDLLNTLRKPFVRLSASLRTTSSKPSSQAKNRRNLREVNNLSIDCEGWSLGELQRTEILPRRKDRIYLENTTTYSEAFLGSSGFDSEYDKNQYFENVLGLIPKKEAQEKQHVPIPPDLRCLTKRSQWKKVPLDWLALFGKKVVFRKSLEARGSCEEFCSTDPLLVSCSIRQNLSMRDPSELKKKLAKDLLSTEQSLGRWYLQQQEISKRRKRASVRAARATLGSSPTAEEVMSCNSSLIPLLEPIPQSILRCAFKGPVFLSNVI